jgi:hypothetical protein
MTNDPLAPTPEAAPPIAESDRVRVSPSVYARAFGEELVLLDFGRGEYFGLDAIGTTIWRRLEAGDTVGGVADAVAAQFEVTRETALRDIAALVGHLREQTLVAVQ